jgi:hypothetical protein
MGDVYAVVNKAKTKFPKSRLVLSGVLRRRDVSWRRIGTLNSIAKTLSITFVDPTVGLRIGTSVGMECT